MATRGSNDTTGGLPDAVVSDLLDADERRIALSILADRGAMVVDDLAAAVVAARDDCAESEVSTADREAMREELYTEHVPKLTATGVVTYDSMTGTVELQRQGIVGRGRA
ncbi:DUF7344 domain-containing protein [Haloarcula litorea]|uniref:DUF7344 domain-containing protein n=1 Tax=Haloarcula litorea TaxID=3032579 RepID=UPI0023E79E9E|nr:hypothetical protein [Halomicroarcula sp. GDY20]